MVAVRLGTVSRIMGSDVVCSRPFMKSKSDEQCAMPLFKPSRRVLTVSQAVPVVQAERPSPEDFSELGDVAWVGTALPHVRSKIQGL